MQWLFKYRSPIENSYKLQAKLQQDIQYIKSAPVCLFVCLCVRLFVRAWSSHFATEFRERGIIRFLIAPEVTQAIQIAHILVLKVNIVRKTNLFKGWQNKSAMDI